MTGSELAIVALALVGMYFSHRAGRVRGRAEERSRRLRPVCPCTHVWGEHRDGKFCQAQVRREHYLSYGARSGYQWIRCACTQYHGPELVGEEFLYRGVVVADEATGSLESDHESR